MPELGASGDKRSYHPPLDLTYDEAAAGAKALGESLDDFLHGRRVLGVKTTAAKRRMTDVAACQRLLSYMEEKISEATAADDRMAVWSCLCFD